MNNEDKEKMRLNRTINFSVVMLGFTAAVMTLFKTQWEGSIDYSLIEWTEWLMIGGCLVIGFIPIIGDAINHKRKQSKVIKQEN